MKSPNINSK